MKKLALLFACLLFVGSMTAQAEGLVIKGGANFTNLKDMDSRPFGWQAGLGFQTEIPDGFGICFQPELIYKVYGVALSDAKDIRRGYVEIPLNVQLGLNIGDNDSLHPFVFAGPYVGLNVANHFKGSWNSTDEETIRNGFKKAQFGLGLGVGIDLWILQVTAKYNWNFGQISGATIDNISLQNSPRIVELCVGLNF